VLSPNAEGYNANLYDQHIVPKVPWWIREGSAAGKSRPGGPTQVSPGRQPWVRAPHPPLRGPPSPKGEGPGVRGDGSATPGLRPGLWYVAPLTELEFVNELQTSGSLATLPFVKGQTAMKLKGRVAVITGAGLHLPLRPEKPPAALQQTSPATGTASPSLPAPGSGNSSGVLIF
jgi:hypothetical protein